MRLATESQIQKAVRRVEEATGKEAVKVDLLPDGGIGVTLARDETPAIPPVSLVTMNEK